MDRQNRIAFAVRAAVIAQNPALVDDLLRPALDLGVAALHRIEVKLRRIRAGRHGAGGAAAHANAHARATELDQQAARREFNLVRLRGVYHAQAAGDHDRLVVTALLLLLRSKACGI